MFNYCSCFQAKAFPVSCGRRRFCFSGIASLPIRTILLNIDNGLPTAEGVQELKDRALPFLEEVKKQLENTTSSSYSIIFAGSIEERFGVPFTRKRDKVPSALDALYSDYDVMFCCESYNATFSSRGNVLIAHHTLRIHPQFDLFLPGIAQLKPLSDFEGQPLNSVDFRKSVSEAVGLSKVANLPGDPCLGICCMPAHAHFRGPAIKVTVDYSQPRLKLFEGDITFCIKCPEWPPLSNWPNRDRLWPSEDDVRRISSNGFHLVAYPMMSYAGNQCLPTWRYSFSMAEVELSKLVPNTARKCLLALKIIFKDHLQPILPQLSSYHIKTVFYNALEKKPESFWVDENVEECFQTLLKDLQHSLKTGQCDHYWLKGYRNLFSSFKEGKLKERLLILAKKVEQISEDPAPFICDDGCCCICACCNCCCKEKKRKEENHVEISSDSSDAILQQPTAASTSYGTFPQGEHIV